MNARTDLHYSVRIKVLFKYLGLLSLVLATLTCVPFFVALITKNLQAVMRYGIVIVCALLMGSLSKLKVNQNFQVNEGFVIVSLIFLISSLLMSLPLMGAGLSFIDAFFESVSGVTTTGLSMISSIDDLPDIFKFGRAWMQWYGGLGIVVFSIAFIIPPGSVASILTDYDHKSLLGGTKNYARYILIVFISITLLGVTGLIFLQIPWKEAIYLALATVSTGGFSPYQTSVSQLDILPLMFLISICMMSATSLIFYYKIFNQYKRVKFELYQIVALLFIGLLWAFCLLALFAKDTELLSRHAILNAFFMAFSAQTTTGFSTLDLQDIDSASKMILIVSMLIGGGIGSTAGGFKILRFLFVISLLKWMVKRAGMSRHTAYDPLFAGQRFDEKEMREMLLLIFLYIGLVVVSWFSFLLYGYDPLNSLFEVTSAVGTVGLSTGLSSQTLPNSLKIILSMDMLLGRIEIFPWLIVFNRRTWIGNRLENG
ncbi:MAG: TrkH family potassium uptake protein [Chlamydiales bacterium]